MMSRPGLTILWALVLAILCHAGPINRQAGGHNTLRPDIRNQSYAEQNVCVSDDVLYQPGDLMPAPTPCARCVCSPPGSLCTPVACEKQPGCKALQRPNQCCPEYQCECERNGRLYANGERLDNADNPCQACYCQGGEVVCTTVECYRRDDCEPQFVPGKCCPKYDHCPPLVMDDSRYGEPFVAGDRPQHTRATFQPSSGLEGDTEIDDGDDDQVLGASSVQERVHVPQQESIAPATTTPTPATATATDAQTSATDAQTPAGDGPDSTTNAPATALPQHDTPQDAAIKIEVPSVPWTDTPESSATDATLAPQAQGEEGSGDADDNTLARKDEPVIGVIERVGVPLQVVEDVTSATEESATAGTTKQDDATEAQTEQEPITRLFMISKEAELDPTTVSSEYTDIPQEMSTTPEETLPAKESTEVKSVDLSTEALLEATATTKESSPIAESATDSSPEFKDFDEWSGSKSSEFLRDSASVGFSGSSAVGSDAHSKAAGSSSDESTSHFLATNINAETVKLSPDSIAVPHSDASATDSTETSESTEESATTEISSTESEISAKTSDQKDHNPEESDSKEVNLQKIDAEKASEEEDVSHKGEIEKKEPNIVLDTDATDENGPPILLIGDDLANHQMDIVVATSSTEEAEVEKPGSQTKRVNQKKTDQSIESTEVTTENATDEPVATTESKTSAQNDKEGDIIAQRIGIETDVSEDMRTEEPDSTTVSPVRDIVDDSQTEAGSGDANDGDSSTEKLESATATEDMMLSDDPLPGQAASAETIAREENINQILGKTGVKEGETVNDETKNHDSAPSATVLSTLPVDEATADPVEMRIGDIRTESPERESTTDTAKEEEKTTIESKYETTTLTNIDEQNDEGERKDSLNVMEEKIVERRAEKPEDINELTEGLTTTENGKENPTTTDNPTTEITASESDYVNEDNTDPKKKADIQTHSIDNEQNDNSDKIKHIESPQDTTKDAPEEGTVTTVVPTTENSVTERASNTEAFDQDVMLGDQPQSSLPAIRLQTVDSKEQKKQEEKDLKKNEEKTEQNIEQDTPTEKIETNESEQEPEVQERIGVEASESTQKPFTDLQADLVETTGTEQNTESVKKSDTDSPTEEVTESLQKTDKPEQQDSETEKSVLEPNNAQEQLSAVNPEQQQAEQVPEEEKYEQSTEILVNSPKKSTNDEVVLKMADKEDFSSDELSTPPADTTSSDKVQEEISTVMPQKIGDTEAPSTDSNVDVTTGAPVKEHISPMDSGAKINPEVLELKPQVVFPSQPESNSTDATASELDMTTLSPEWLKSDNDTKGDSTNGQKKLDQVKDKDVEAETEKQTSLVGEGSEHQRLERRVDETDKKDLFLLEDFFTKLYRHQIATDANKEH